MSIRTILNFLAEVFLENGLDYIHLMAMSLLFFAGLWGMFEKCGLKGWYALIPCYRDVKMGEATGREKDGRVLAVARGVTILINLIITVFPQEAPAEVGQWVFFLAMIQIVVGMVVAIYLIRIGLGFIEVFDRKKRWIILWIFASFIPSCLWGWGKKHQPLWTVKELQSQNSAAGFFSNSRAAVLDQGLTVNIEERTARDFFKTKYLLRDIHMYIKPGHMVLLLGGSGAGKTTYLNAVNGYEKAKAEVVLNGRNMYKNYKEMQYDIGFVPQLDLMRGSDSVFRTLMDAAALRLPAEFSKADRQARVEEVMNIFGLTPVKDNLVVKLSGGQRKRLSIAMEFISNPSLFILDEPDSGLDGVMARELFQQLRQIADQGKIIIVITHTPDRVIDLFDDVIVLAKDSNRTGRLAYFGPIEEARTFFGKEKMEEIVKSVNREEEGGEGRADEFILKYAEVQHV